MGNKFLTQNFNPFPENNKYALMDKGTENQWFDPTIEEISESRWTNVTDENLYYRTEYGKFSLYRNELTLEEVEKYKLVLKDREEFNKFSNLVKWRNNCQYLPKVEHFIIENKTEICVSQFEVNIFIERIPLRLADLTDIPFPENLYFLSAILKGYKYIFGSLFNVKMFKPSESMIGVNREGEVKVWWNENLSSNEAVDSNEVFISEEDFVKAIVDMVEQNSDEREYPYQFKKYLSDRNIPINGDFNHMISQIYNYAKEMKVLIPKCAFSVREILNRDLFENTKISSNSFSTNQFKGDHKMHNENNHNNSQEQFMRKDTFGLSNEHFVGESYIDNNHSHDILETAKFKSNSGIISNNNLNEPIRISPFDHENKVNSGFSLIHKLPEKQHIDTYKNEYLSFNKFGKNVVQFTNNAYGYNQQNQNRTYILPEKHNTLVSNNVMMTHSHPVKFNQPNTNQVKFSNANKNELIIPQQHFSSIIEHKNENYDSLSFNPSRDSLPMYSGMPETNSQFLSNPMNRYNSNMIPSTYQTQSNQNLPNLLHQNSTPIFSQPLKPKELSTKMEIEHINRVSSSIPENSDINNFSQNKSHESHNTKSISIRSNNDEEILNKAPEQIKVRYFTKKDSQESLDPEIMADLAKYLGHT